MNDPIAETDAVMGYAVPGDTSPVLVLRADGKIVYDDVLVGRFDRADALLTVDLGWCKAAGVHVTIKADPEVDRARSGIVLSR